jgi:hypothetical protein
VTRLTEPALGDAGIAEVRHRSTLSAPRSLWTAWLLVGLLLLPALLAAWTIPSFVTQDGPTHLYNAWILAHSFSSSSAFEPYYTIYWQPLPNWAAHLILTGMLQVVSPWVADRLMITATGLGFAASLVWLRWKTRGGRGLLGACLPAAILSLNFLWIMGFSSFLLGCCLFAITLGAWWSGRDDLRTARVVMLAGLLVLGYFAHLVSLGLTVLGLGFLAVLGPMPGAAGSNWPVRLRLGLRTGLALLPLAVLGLIYVRLSRQGGAMHPVWENIGDPLTVGGWVARFGWVDPVSIARKSLLPFTERTGAAFVVLTPVIWLVLSGAIAAIDLLVEAARAKATAGVDEPGGRDTTRRTRLVWLAFGAVLLAAGLLGPDSFGSGHGEFLPQRMALLGLAALVPALDIDLKRFSGWLIAGSLLVSLCLQTTLIWDHALYSERTAGQIIQAADRVGRHQRVATVLIGIKSRFRANPLLHADSWVGTLGDNILWSNYETRHYYFPVHFRPSLDRPDPFDFEKIALDTDPQAGLKARGLWERILTEHHGSIDKVLVWGSDPALDAITSRWCDLESAAGEVRVFVPRREIDERPAVP